MSTVETTTSTEETPTDAVLALDPATADPAATAQSAADGPLRETSARFAALNRLPGPAKKVDDLPVIRHISTRSTQVTALDKLASVVAWADL